MEKQLPEVQEVPTAHPRVVHVQKSIHIQFAPQSLAGRIVAVTLAVVVIVLAFFFLAAAIVLFGILLAIGIGKVLWSSRNRANR